MKKIFFIFFLMFATQNIIAQVAQSNTLYLLYDPQDAQSTSEQIKSNDALTENQNGELREEDGYEYAKKNSTDPKGFYPFLFITIDRTQFITVTLSQLSNYPVKTVDQVRAEANPTNKYFFTNRAYFEPIEHYYIVEKNISAGTAKIVKVTVRFPENEYSED
jgi:hypothetical protein